jgi:hypothetical protein
MLPKSEIGAACNGCGLCCQTVVCSAGSFILGLVADFGDRADGPCPALVPDGPALVCGLMKRPSDYIGAHRGPTVLRGAVAVLIGAGAGCDEIGDEPEATARPKLKEVQAAYLRRYSKDQVNGAWRTVLEGRE